LTGIALLVLWIVIAGLLPFRIPDNFFIGFFLGVFYYIGEFYLFPSLDLDRNSDRAELMHQEMLARWSLRKWLRFIAFSAVIAAAGLILAVFASYLFNRESPLTQRIIEWGSFIIGLLIGLLAARWVDKLVQWQKAVKDAR